VRRGGVGGIKLFRPTSEEMKVFLLNNNNNNSNNNNKHAYAGTTE
jgi:hypothetical protein